MQDVWGIFDPQAGGTVSLLQFAEVYTLFNLYPDKNELNLTFKKYNVDKDNLLKFNDLIKMFGPKDQRYCELFTNRKSFNQGKCYLRASCFFPETMHDFKSLLLQIINTEIRVNDLKKQLHERKNFDITKAFIALGGAADGSVRINIQNFNKFFISHNFVANER